MAHGAWTFGGLQLGVVLGGGVGFAVGIASGKKRYTVLERLDGETVVQLAPGVGLPSGSLDCYMDAQGRAAVEAVIAADTPATLSAPDGESWPNLLLVEADDWQGVLGSTGDRLVRLTFQGAGV